jgi:DeoR/GlpR family transcriptional regulator of sugar metabolism
MRAGPADIAEIETGKGSRPARGGGRMPAPARQARIVEAVRSAGFVSVVDIAAELVVSEMTIRRDLIELEREGLLERTHGGAVAVDGPPEHPIDKVEPEFEARLRRNREAKERIARAAFDMINGQRTIALDVGTTTYMLARHLAERPGGPRVFTNSLRIAGLLGARKNEVYVAGGQIRGDEMTVSGPMAVGQFEQLWFDTAFIGVSGLTEAGLFDYSLEDSELKRVYVRRSFRKVVLCDASKFQRMSLVQIATLKEIDTLISDAEPPAELGAALAQAKVAVHIAASR